MYTPASLQFWVYEDLHIAFDDAYHIYATAYYAHSVYTDAAAAAYCAAFFDDTAATYSAYASGAANNAYHAAEAFHDTGTENRMQTAGICRKYIGDLIIEKVNELLK